MPAGKENIVLPVSLEVDKKSVDKTADTLRKALSEATLDLKKLASIKISSIGDLKKFASILDKTAKNVHSIAKDSEKVAGSALSVSGGIGGSGTGKVKSLEKQMKDINTYMTGYSRAIKENREELNKSTKAQKEAAQALQNLAKFSGKDMMKGISGAFASKSPKAMAGGIAGAAGKGIAGAGLRALGGPKILEKGAFKAGKGFEHLQGAQHLKALVPVLKAVTGGFMGLAGILGVVWAAIKFASDHQTKLNKTLMEGTGFANDFMASSQNYRDVVNDIRNATINAAGGLLKFGVNSEKALKIINTYAKESTGSLGQTRTALIALGGGDIKKGVETFARNAEVYGRALGVEATEIAATMGQFQVDMGYGASQTQDLMRNVVTAAATANMPMTKFMSIFKSVIPDVELYQNRLEELTGTIRLLSKTMDPKSVQSFMNAFAKGFKGADFKSRLKTYFITSSKKGADFIPKILSKSFETKARTMAQELSKYTDPEEFMAAMKGGEAKMAALMADIQARAAADGAEVTGTQISNAMQLASYEAARQKGGPLNIATAMRGASMYDTYKILEAQSQTFTQGFDGLSEHVIKQTGISEEQYDMLRKTHQSMQANKAQVQLYGKTTSKSMNKALAQVIWQRKYFNKDNKVFNENQVTLEDMKNATEEDFFRASEEANKTGAYQATAENLAAEQVSATLSIDEKIDNVLGFLLEKLVKLMQPILDLLDYIWGWMTGEKEQKALIKSIDGWAQGFEKSQASETQKQQYKIIGDSLRDSVSSGANNKEMAKAVAGQFDLKTLRRMNPKDITNMVYAAKGDDETASKVTTAFTDALNKGDVAGALEALSGFGQLAPNIMNLANKLVGAGMVGEKAKEAAAMRRGTALKKQQTAAELQSSRTAKPEDVDTGQVRLKPVEQTPEQIRQAKIQAKKEAKAKKEAEEAASRATSSTEGEAARLQAFLAGSPLTGDAKAQEEAKKREEKAKQREKEGAAGTLTTPEEQSKARIAAAKAAAAAGTPEGATPGTAGAPEATPEAQKTAEAAQTTATDTKKAAEVADETYGKIEDVAGILKKGIKFENSWMGSKYKNFVKDVTYDAFQQALLEAAILQAKLDEKVINQKDFAGMGTGLAAAGASLSDIATGVGGGGKYLGIKGKGGIGEKLKIKGWDEGIAAAPAKKKQMGGPIPDTGMYKLHAGEYVLPAAEAAAAKRGAGGGGAGAKGGVVANITINGTNLSQQQLKGAVISAMDEFARRQ